MNEANNPKIACVRGTAEAFNVNCNDATGTLRVLDVSQNVYYDTFSNTQGFDKDGKVCSGFDAVNGDFQCPLRANISWRANCISDPCYNPTDIVVEVNFEYKTSDSDKKIAFNPTNYDFAFSSTVP